VKAVPRHQQELKGSMTRVVTSKYRREYKRLHAKTDGGARETCLKWHEKHHEVKQGRRVCLRTRIVLMVLSCVSYLVTCTSLKHPSRWLLQRPSPVIQQLAHLLALGVEVFRRLSNIILSTGRDFENLSTSVAVAQQSLERLYQPFHRSQQFLFF